MAIKPEILKYRDSAVEMLDKLDKNQAKIAPKLKDLDAKVHADAKLDEPKMGKVHKSALAKLLKDIDADRMEAMGAKSVVDHVVGDEDFIDEFLDEAEKLKKRQEELSELLLAQYKQAKELENLAEENIAKDEGDADEMFDQLAVFETTTTNFQKRIKEISAQVADLISDAHTATINRDAAALAAAQKKSANLDLSDFQSFTEFYKRVLQSLKERSEAVNDKDTKAKAQLKDSVDDLNKASEEIAIELKSVEFGRETIKNKKIAPVDVKKALKTLGLAAAVEGKLAKVLKGAPADYEKGLTALAKELKLKETGKQLLEKLEKAKIV